MDVDGDRSSHWLRCKPRCGGVGAANVTPANWVQRYGSSVLRENGDGMTVLDFKQSGASETLFGSLQVDRLHGLRFAKDLVASSGAQRLLEAGRSFLRRLDLSKIALIHKQWKQLRWLIKTKLHYFSKESLSGMLRGKGRIEML
jgi:hypothetical protein